MMQQCSAGLTDVVKDVSLIPEHNWEVLETGVSENRRRRWMTVLPWAAVRACTWMDEWRIGALLHRDPLSPWFDEKEPTLVICERCCALIPAVKAALEGEAVWPPSEHTVVFLFELSAAQVIYSVLSMSNMTRITRYTTCSGLVFAY